MKKKLSIILCIVLLLSTSLFLSACSQENSMKLKWESDLVLLKQELLEKDIGLRNNPELAQIFGEQMNQVIRNLHKLRNDDQVKVEVSKAIASIGQLHTFLGFDLDKVLPLELFMDGKSLYVTGTLRNYSQTLHSRLVEINHYPVSKITEQLSEVIPLDNEVGLNAMIPSYIRLPSILHGLGVIENKDEAKLTFEKDDKSRITMTVKFVSINDNNLQIVNPEAEKMLFMKHRKENYGFSYLSDEQALYIAYNRCEEDPTYSMQLFTQEILQTIRENPIQRIILDLRGNPGGNSFVIDPLIDKLQYETEVKDRIIVLIDRGTSSSAIINAIEFKNIFQAVLIGEPPNGGMNKPGDILPIQLPSTGLTVFYSTKEFHLMETDNDSLIPDIQVEHRIEHFKTGDDPILKAALTHKFNELD